MPLPVYRCSSLRLCHCGQHFYIFCVLPYGSNKAVDTVDENLVGDEPGLRDSAVIASEICDGTENCQSPGYIVTGKLLCTYAI